MACVHDIQGIPALTTVSSLLEKSNGREYRYYHCQMSWKGMKCKPVSGPAVMPTDDHTKLLFVNSYYPECFDSQILKCKWMPTKVVIEEKTT
jgi:hypothetical protein